MHGRADTREAAGDGADDHLHQSGARPPHLGRGGQEAAHRRDKLGLQRLVGEAIGEQQPQVAHLSPEGAGRPGEAWEIA